MKQPRDDTESVFVVVMLEPALGKKFRSKKTIQDYAKDLGSLAAEFAEVLRFATRVLPYRWADLPALVFGYLTAGFDFERFRKARSELWGLDSSHAGLIAAREALS
jgi:hypothetical protein